MCNITQPIKSQSLFKMKNENIWFKSENTDTSLFQRNQSIDSSLFQKK